MILTMGQTVWLRDFNRRVYPSGHGHGLNYREHFIPVTVIGETRLSYDLEGGLKIRKSLGEVTRPRPGLSATVYLSQEAVEDECWLHDNRGTVSGMVLRCNDAAVLRRVKELLEGVK